MFRVYTPDQGRAFPSAASCCGDAAAGSNGRSAAGSHQKHTLAKLRGSTIWKAPPLARTRASNVRRQRDVAVHARLQPRVAQRLHAFNA